MGTVRKKGKSSYENLTGHELPLNVLLEWLVSILFSSDAGVYFAAERVEAHLPADSAMHMAVQY